MRGTKLNRWHVFFYETFQPLAVVYLKLFFDYTYKKAPKREENYIVLSNHVSDYDPIFVAASFRKQMYFVASEHIARWGWLFKIIDFLVSPIMRYKGTVAASTAIDILKRVKSGSNVCVFAEGVRTWDGVSSPIMPSTAKLIKKAGCGLYTYKIIGGYFASPMWCGSNTRRGPIHGAPVNYYSKEQLLTMTTDEIYEAIIRDLHEDAYERQIAEPKRYRGKNLAEGLENLMFICPSCKQRDAFESKGNTVYCKHCGLTYTYDEYGMLRDGDFTTVKEFVDWQKEQIVEDVKENIAYTAKEATLSTVKEHKEDVVSKGELTLSRDGLVCGDVTVALSDISEMATHGQRAVVFSAGRQYYELIPSKEANALKFYLYYMEWCRQKDEK